MQFFDNNCLSHHHCVSRTPVFREHHKKNCASQDCSASHHCRLVSNLFEIRHAKHLWFTHAKEKLSFTHHTSPLLNWRRPETCKTRKLKTVPPAMQISFGKIMQHAGQNKTFVWFWLFPCDMPQNTHMLRGPFVQHEPRPKWLLPVLCCTHRLLSS